MHLLWSSRNKKFISHAMTHEEMSTLCDVYQTLASDWLQEKTSYVLQTLWWDLTSSETLLTFIKVFFMQVDIVGPHYTSDGTMHHKFLLPTLMDAIFKFHKCGFNTRAVEPLRTLL